MADLSGLQIFKYLPAAKKAENSNCKKCGCPTCMAYALKLAKKAVSMDLCPFIPKDLQLILNEANKIPQKTVEIEGLKIGGENVLYRHEKTFINPTTIALLIDTDKPDWKNELEKAKNFEIQRLNDIFKVDLFIFRGKNSEEAKSLANGNSLTYDEFMKQPLIFIEDDNFKKTSDMLIVSRKKAVVDKDEKFSAPVCVVMKENLSKEEACARASYYLCKYANIILMKTFDEAMYLALMMLRQNIFTDPQKPMQVESKIYEFNNPDENSLIFMTTNFALTFFAVAGELESLKESSYLVVTPADGMSVLTAWSAEKFTAQMAVRTIKKYGLNEKVKNRKIIIPGLLSHMKKELEEELAAQNLNFEIVIGTIEAFKIKEFVKELTAGKPN